MPTAIRPKRTAARKPRAARKVARTVRKGAAALPANFTVHGLDADLAKALREYADRSNASLNAAAKELLRRSLGLPTSDEKARIEEWKSVLGSIPKEDGEDWLKTLEAFEQIDEEMWT